MNNETTIKIKALQSEIADNRYRLEMVNAKPHLKPIWKGQLEAQIHSDSVELASLQQTGSISDSDYIKSVPASQPTQPTQPILCAVLTAIATTDTPTTGRDCPASLFRVCALVSLLYAVIIHI